MGTETSSRRAVVTIRASRARRTFDHVRGLRSRRRSGVPTRSARTIIGYRRPAPASFPATRCRSLARPRSSCASSSSRSPEWRCTSCCPASSRCSAQLPARDACFPAWFVPIFVLEAAGVRQIWVLQCASHSRPTTVVRCRVRSSRVMRSAGALPGGAATGGTTMYQMLTRSGFDGPTASTALTAVGLLSTATLFVLPVLALRRWYSGSRWSSELLQGAILGGVLGIFLLTGASILLVSDRVVRSVGRLLDWVVVRVLRRPLPAPPLTQRLVESRDFARTCRSPSRGSGQSRPRWATDCSTSSRCTSACSRSGSARRSGAGAPRLRRRQRARP